MLCNLCVWCTELRYPRVWCNCELLLCVNNPHQLLLSEMKLWHFPTLLAFDAIGRPGNGAGSCQQPWLTAGRAAPGLSFLSWHLKAVLSLSRGWANSCTDMTVAPLLAVLSVIWGLRSLYSGLGRDIYLFMCLKCVSTELFFPKAFEAWVVSVIARISSCKSCSSWSLSPWGWGRRGALGFGCLEIGSWKGVSPFCFIFVLWHLFFQSLYPPCPVL